MLRMLFEPGYFLQKMIVYSALLGVQLVLTGIIFGAWAQSIRNRERKAKEKHAG